jgi:hypothetical protein
MWEDVQERDLRKLRSKRPWINSVYLGLKRNAGWDIQANWQVNMPYMQRTQLALSL